MSPEELRRLSRPELIERAEALGIPRPKTLTTGELVDEIVTRTAPPGTARRGWLGKARDLVAAVVERGLHLPEAARVLRATQRRAPAPPPPLPTVTLAEIYAAQGYFGKAVTVLNEVLRREPEHDEATTLRARFAGRMSEAEREELGVDESGAELEPVVTDADEAADDVPVVTDADEAADDVPADPSDADVTDEEVIETAAEPAPKPSEPDAPPTEAVVIEAEAPAAAIKPKAQEERSQAEAVPLDTGAAHADRAPTDPTPDAVAGDADISVEEEPELDDDMIETIPVPPRAEPSAPESVVVEVQAEAELDTRETPAAAPADEADVATDEPLERDDEVYDIDDVVGLAVDSHTVYAYWEVRPTTFARSRWGHPDARLVLRVLVAGAGLDGASAHVETRDVAIDELVGDTFIRGLPAAAEVRLCVGMLDDGGFTPLAVAPELSTPRGLSDEPAAAPSVLPPSMTRSFTPSPHAPTSPEGAALAVQQWAMFSRSRSGELTTVDFGGTPAGMQPLLVRRTLRSEVVRGGASDLSRRDQLVDEWALRWGPGGASDMVRGHASDLSRGHASDLSRPVA